MLETPPCCLSKVEWVSVSPSIIQHHLSAGRLEGGMLATRRECPIRQLSHKALDAKLSLVKRKSSCWCQLQQPFRPLCAGNDADEVYWKFVTIFKQRARTVVLKSRGCAPGVTITFHNDVLELVSCSVKHKVPTGVNRGYYCRM